MSMGINNNGILIRDEEGEVRGHEGGYHLLDSRITGGLVVLRAQDREGWEEVRKEL